MSETNIALIGAFLTAVAGIAAPVFSAKISRKSSLQLKSVDLFFSAKLNAYRDFLSAASSRKEIDRPLSYDQLNDLHRTAAQAALFSSPDTQAAINGYCNLIMKNSSAEEDILAISKAYADAITSMKHELDKYDYNHYKRNQLSRCLHTFFSSYKSRYRQKKTKERNKQ